MQLALSLSLLTLVATAAFADLFTVQTITGGPITYGYSIYFGLIPGGAALLHPTGITDSGTVVGIYEPFGSQVPDPYAPFLYSGGAFIPSPPPDLSVPSSIPTAISPNGNYVAGFTSSNYDLHLQSGSSPAVAISSALPLFGYPLDNLSAVNNTGTAVGFAFVTGGSVGLLYSNGLLSTVQYPGSTFTSLSGINDLGQIVGFAITPNGDITFLYQNGMFTLLSVPADLGAIAINDSGEILASVSGVDGIYVNGQFTPLSSLITNDPFSADGFSESGVDGLNNLGQIVGTNASGELVIATPISQVPEPALSIGVALALLGIFFFRYVRAAWPRESLT